MRPAAAAVAAAPAGGGTSKILRIGTTYYIDTLNPFVGIETQDSTAYGMVFPQLVQYGPGLKLVGDWAKSWTHSADGLVWTFHLRPGGKWSDGVPADRAGRGVDDPDDSSSTRPARPRTWRACCDGVKAASAPNRNTLVITYSHAGRPGARQPGAVLHPARARVGQAHRQQRQRPEGVPPRAAPADGLRRPVHRSPSTRRRARRSSSPTRTSTGRSRTPPRSTLTYYTNSTSMVADLSRGNLDFVDAVPYTAGSALKSQHGHHAERPGRQRGHEPRLQLQPEEAEEPRAPEPDGEGGVRVRDPAPADRRTSSSAATPSRGRTSCRPGQARRAGSTRP